ncbi:MAG: RNA methyltransferase [Oscillospiraceae bacterium]|jgi:TrmH family RNA methyltransferase|nr:RNA methyltransferase [Oscillospiraceae bacterium]
MKTLTSKENPCIKQAVALRKSAAERRAQSRFFLEGFRLCADALASGYAPVQLFCTSAARQKYDTTGLEAAAAEGYEIPESLAAKLGETETPQGVFAVFSMAFPAAHQNFWEPCGRYIALEQVQDPGNLGAIARTAEALGVTGLLCSGGCDPYHPKAQRAAMGALLRWPVLTAVDFCDGLQQAKALGLQTYAAVPDATATPVTQVHFGDGAVIAIGNEGSGLSEAALAVCGERITIPMPGRAESLNAAAAATILLWRLTTGG